MLAFAATCVRLEEGVLDINILHGDGWYVGWHGVVVYVLCSWRGGCRVSGCGWLDDGITVLAGEDKKWAAGTVGSKCSGRIL